VVQSGDVKWLTVTDVGWECLRLVCYSIAEHYIVSRNDVQG